jgi:hypothetical protein
MPARDRALHGRAELAVTETAIEALRRSSPRWSRMTRRRVHPEWVRANAMELDTVVHEDPIRARLEIMKHLEGDL